MFFLWQIHAVHVFGMMTCVCKIIKDTNYRATEKNDNPIISCLCFAIYSHTINLKCKKSINMKSFQRKNSDCSTDCWVAWLMIDPVVIRLANKSLLQSPREVFYNNINSNGRSRSRSSTSLYWITLEISRWITILMNDDRR